MIGFSSNHPQLPTGHALNINHNRFYWKSISGIVWNFQFIYLACTFLAQLNFHFWYEIKHSLTKSVGNRHFHILSDSLKLGGTFKVHILLSVYSFFSKWKVAKHKKSLLVDFVLLKNKSATVLQNVDSFHCPVWTSGGIERDRKFNACYFMNAENKKDKKLYTLQNTSMCLVCNQDGSLLHFLR